jgi:hypothetical protein
MLEDLQATRYRHCTALYCVYAHAANSIATAAVPDILLPEMPLIVPQAVDVRLNAGEFGWTCGAKSDRTVIASCALYMY